MKSHICIHLREDILHVQTDEIDSPPSHPDPHTQLLRVENNYTNVSPPVRNSQKAICSHELLRLPFLTHSHTSAYVSIRQYMSAYGILMNYFFKVSSVSDPSALVPSPTQPLIPLTVVQPTDQVQLSEVSGHHLETQENASMNVNVSLSNFHPISLGDRRDHPKLLPIKKRLPNRSKAEQPHGRVGRG
jgi:hypothetical protein